MKKLIFFFSALAGIFQFSNSVNAQIHWIGEGQFVSVYTNNNDYGPMRSRADSASSSRYAMIYAASSLSRIASGQAISALEFMRGGVATIDMSSAQFKIYLKNSTRPDFGAGNINWVTEAASATLVYDADPSAVVDTGIGYKRFILSTPFTYTGGNIEVYIEYVQTTAQTGDITWRYDNNITMPDYANNTNKYVINNSALFSSDSTTLSNNRKPVIRFIYQQPLNVQAQYGTMQQHMFIGEKTIPEVVIWNTGLGNAENIVVTATGPEGYLSTRQITNLAVNDYTAVVFDTMILNNIGTAQIIFTTSLNNDIVPKDDTLRVPIEVVNPTPSPGIFENKGAFNLAGVGASGANVSGYYYPFSTLGNNINNPTWRMGENFVLPAGANYQIDSLGFYAYQTSSGFNTTMTGVFVMIYDEDPRSGTAFPIYGDSINNLLSNTYYSGINRTAATSLATVDRPLMRVVAEFTPVFSLQGGKEYWIEWSMTGSSTSGPWQAPAVFENKRGTGNAFQRLSNFAYTPYRLDILNAPGVTAVSYPVGAPFEIFYKVDATSVNNLESNRLKVGQIFPNPAHEKFNVNIELQRNEKVEVRITDLQGRQLLVQQFGQMSEGKHTLELPAASLSNGMYLVQIQSGNQLTTRKLQIH